MSRICGTIYWCLILLASQCIEQTWLTHSRLETHSDASSSRCSNVRNSDSIHTAHSHYHKKRECILNIIFVSKKNYQVVQGSSNTSQRLLYIYVLARITTRTNVSLITPSSPWRTWIFGNDECDTKGQLMPTASNVIDMWSIYWQSPWII